MLLVPPLVWLSPVEARWCLEAARWRARFEASDVRVVELEAACEAKDAEVAGLLLRVARLEHLGRADSTNSSTPPSRESMTAAAKRKAQRVAKTKRDNGLSSRERDPNRKRGGQPGHPGSGLARDPQARVKVLDAPAVCGSCQAGLGPDADAGWLWAQGWDIPRIELSRLELRLPRRCCGQCGQVTTAPAPAGAHAGSVSYGPNVNAVVILLNNHGNVPVELTADLMAALVGAPVSTGFVVKDMQRLSARLLAAGFDEAMKVALRAEPVLGADESPVNVVEPDRDPEPGEPLPGAAHLLVVNSIDRRLVWYTPMTSRSGKSIKDAGILDGYTGFLVRDGYTGYQQFEDTLAGVQQCCVHIIRRLKRVVALGPGGVQKWASDMIKILRELHDAVEAAKVAGATSLDPQVEAGFRARYDKAVQTGITHNRHRDWDGDGNHPGYALARWLQAKTDQVWLFTHEFIVPWTSNSSEQSVRAPKRHQAVSGYWQSSDTLDDYCRVKSYLTSARNHGIHPFDAIQAALGGTPWLPTPAAPPVAAPMPTPEPAPVADTETPAPEPAPVADTETPAPEPAPVTDAEAPAPEPAPAADAEAPAPEPSTLGVWPRPAPPSVPARTVRHHRQAGRRSPGTRLPCPAQPRPG